MLGSVSVRLECGDTTAYHHWSIHVSTAVIVVEQSLTMRWLRHERSPLYQIDESKESVTNKKLVKNVYELFPDGLASRTLFSPPSFIYTIRTICGPVPFPASREGGSSIAFSDERSIA